MTREGLEYMSQEMMNALRLNGPNDLEYCQVPVPAADENEVLCQVESVSICGTDPHIIKGDFPGYWPKQFPLIPGHEWAGKVVGLGENAGLFGWKIGDRVAGIANCGCGYCKNCMEGRFTICLNYGKDKIHNMYGHITAGAYAQYLKVNIKSISKIPDDMDYNIASCMDPLSIALHMAMRCGIEVGDTVLINGAGAQGLMSIICCKSMGAGMIIVTGSGRRLEAAKEMGAVTVNYREEDVNFRIMQLTGGLGVKRVLECSGTASGIAQASNVIARGGCITTISLPVEDVILPVRKFVLDEIDFHGSRANPNTLDKAISLAQQNRKEIEKLITHVFDMSDFKRAFEVFNGRLDNSLKVILKPAR